MSRLGILAGSGELPALLMQACRRRGWDFHVFALRGHADPVLLGDAPQDWVRLGGLGLMRGLLRQRGVDRVVFAGKVERPRMRELMIDLRTALFLARIGGRLISDNRLLEAIVREVESWGVAVIGAADVEPSLLARKGPYGTLMPTEGEDEAIVLGFAAAREAGRRDVGQAAVVQGRRVLDTEGADGTNALIKRCASLQESGRGAILVKARKPQQQMRSDPPVIGLATVERAAAAGFRGIAVEAGGTLILESAAIGRAADAAGMFIVGVDMPE
ncbi:MAG TPA: UDP-2,3-diacylglucosamine diphosphatase LpxI [Dongiaceae bacterium]|nr:UDP-2,3-diacylglucosamine diphosphatase LpxI [Dongiaceae bacterium]